jgi:broad specificity phosphatase PhoE
MTESTTRAGTTGHPPARLILLRHGQASLGTDDYDRLSELGRSQALALRARLAAAQALGDVIVSGSLKRQRQTVAGLGRSHAAGIDESLNEYTVDQLIRSTLEQAGKLGIQVPGDEAFADPKSYLKTFLDWFPEVLMHWQAARLQCEHNGPWADFHARVTAPIPGWSELVASGRTVVVVSSAGVISTVVSEMLGEDLAWQRALNVRLYNASLTELRLDAHGQWRAETINCVQHLESEAVTLA